MPAGLVVLGLPFSYAFATWPADTAEPWGFHLLALPTRWPSGDEFDCAALLLALRQIALSLGNSLFATKEVVADFFPECELLTERQIGTTYGLMNLVAAPLGGLPVCHGSGGIVGHYVFGARTGGSAVICGPALVFAGLFLVNAPAAFLRLGSGPIWGALLLVEAVAVLALVRDQWRSPAAYAHAVTCGLTAAFAPNGCAGAVIVGTLPSMPLRRRWV